jgi:hypothetical protein
LRLETPQRFATHLPPDIIREETIGDRRTCVVGCMSLSSTSVVRGETYCGTRAFLGACRMIWLVTAVTVVAGIVALLVALLVRRAPRVHELGAVSSRWIEEHRVDSL